MHDPALIDVYGQFHPRWFESPARYVPSDEHVRAYSSAMDSEWSLERNGIWYVARLRDTVVPAQGWKLHVSALTNGSTACLAEVLPVLRDSGTTFKFLVDSTIANAVNGKLWTRASSGKLITVYPTSEAEFLELGDLLARRLRGYKGPYILSDRPWPKSNCVFYRYGAFRSMTTLRPDGTFEWGIRAPDGRLVPDERNPFWSPPSWVSDPVPAFDTPGSTAEYGPGLDSGRFEVSSAFSFSNRGGVYRAFDRESGDDVVIKEARPGVTLGRHRVDAVAALRKEHRLLEALADTGRFVKPVKYFEEGGHAFLVEELISGDHLGHFTIRHNPLYQDGVTREAVAAYLGDMREIWSQLAEAIAVAHDRRIVLGDLSFTNIIVTDTNKLVLFDLECAMEEGVDEQIGLHTPGMASPATLQSGMADRANDYYSLGALIFGSVMLVNTLTEFHPPALELFLSELSHDLALPTELVRLIRDLTTEQTEAICPDPRQVQDAIANLGRRPEGANLRKPRLAIPAEIRLSPAKRAMLSTQVSDTRDGIASYLLNVADLDRADRLVPADLAVFESNPLSVAFGAAGVLHSLHRIAGGALEPLLDWLLQRRRDSGALPPGLYTGQAGVAWVLNELGHQEEAIATMRDARSHPLLWESQNLLWGASGFGLASLKMWMSGLGEEFLDDARSVGEHLRSTAVDEGQGAFWRSADGTVPIGYAYGGSGPALFLLYLYLATGDREHLRLARAALDHELSNAVWRGGRFLGFPSQVERDPAASDVVARCYWDAGTAGVATTLVRYLAINPDPVLAQWVGPFVANMSRKYVVFPQLFHGLAGLGNGLLDVWQFMGDERALRSAWQVAEGILLFRIDRDEGVAYPGEQVIRESGDLASGGAGVRLFLDRLLAAESAGPGSPSAENANFLVDGLITERLGSLSWDKSSAGTSPPAQ